MDIQSSFPQAVACFPPAFRPALERIPAEQADSIQELRLRTGRNLHAVIRGKELAVTQNGLVPEPANGITTGAQEIEAVFKNLCTHSVHSYQASIRRGFVTSAGGNRAGLAGTAVLQGGEIENIRAVSAINLRIASRRTGCAAALAAALGDDLFRGGILLCGAPASGKTTLLRDLVRIAGGSRRVCAIDERGELSAVQNGIPQFDLGLMTDVLDGFPKAAGIEMATRTLNPELLACDEIGGAGEAEQLVQSVHCGVGILATAHAGSLRELREKRHIAALIGEGVFRIAVMLGTGEQCGAVQGITRLCTR